MRVSYRNHEVLQGIDLDIPAGKLVGIVGPNGAGKSTLIKACLGIVPMGAGSVQMLGGTYEQHRLDVGYVPQRESVDWDFPVSASEVVAMGTYGRLGLFRPIGKQQRAEAMAALKTVGLADLAHRQIGQLSGGQQQRVFLARALVQRASIYLMDEPMASVDATTEERILAVLHGLRDSGCTPVVVHHDLGTAAQFFDWIVLLNRTIVASGPPEVVLTRANLHMAYGGHLAAFATREAAPLRDPV
ncbi:MAG: metal ABC transporter ATP-binding protein [Phycisphaerales bacterium]|nr:metal ABC transporter ATP-binding protein [Phycisphaerales bacterium]